jgi:uncharacterized cupin superfamily protein
MSVTPHVLRLDSATVASETYFLPAEKLLAGNPQQTLWMHYTKEEYCHMLQGNSIITDAQGVATTVTAGQSFVMPRGFVGTWEVVEATTKRFVIYEAKG